MAALGAVVLVSLAAAGSAQAARIAAVVVSPDPAAAELADNLTEVLVAALAKGDAGGASGIVGQEELKAQLKQSDKGILGCVGEPPCLTRVGQALKVDWVLVATVSRSVGDEFLVNANAVDVQSGKVNRTLLRRPRGQKALIEVVRALATDLLKPATAVLRVEANVEADIYVDDELSGRGRLVVAKGLKPGLHKVAAKAPGMTGYEGQVTLIADEERSLGVSLVKIIVQRPFYKTWWFWTIIGAAAAGGTAAGVVVGTRTTPLPTTNLSGNPVPFTGALR